MMEFKLTDKRKIYNLFTIKRFKQNYSDFINNLMWRLYQNGHWNKLLGDGNYGIVNTEYSLEKLKYSKDANLDKEIREYYVKVHDNKDPMWSLLNYVNTHWTSFAEIVDTLNYFIIKGYKNNNEKVLLNFDNDYFENLERVKYLMIKYAYDIFFPHDNLTIFYRIMSAIAKSTYIGNKGECLTMKYLSNIGEISDVIKSEPGQRIDTHKGVDVKFKLNGVKKTLQCKSFTDHEVVDNVHVFRNISNPGWYNVDYFSFVNSKNGHIFVFDTTKNGLKYTENRGAYVFDKDLLEFEIKI